MTTEFDIAVIGAGPAGANAALAAASKGLRVVLVDEQPKVGGQVWRAKSAAILSAPTTPETIAGEALRAAIDKSPITHMDNTRVWQIAREGASWALQTYRRNACETLTATSLILATGAREYVQPVPGWTTPGVLGLAGATALFKQTLIPPGKRTIVSGTGPLVFYVASEIRRLGGSVAAIITPNTRSEWARALPAMAAKPALVARGSVWIADLMLARVPIYWGHAVTSVSGDTQVSSVEFSKLDKTWGPVGKTKTIAGDSLCLGHGLLPQIEAAQMLGVATQYDAALGGWVPDVQDDGANDVPGLYLCGDGTGIRGADAARLHGTVAGLRAAGDLGQDTANDLRGELSKWQRSAKFGLAMTALSAPRSGMADWTTDQTIVCRCESIAKQTMLDEIETGAASTNAVKSGLRAGMGPCGGKYCLTAVASLIAQHRGVNSADVPPPTPRPPLRPVPVSAVAGAFDYDDLPIPKPAPL